MGAELCADRQSHGFRRGIIEQRRSVDEKPHYRKSGDGRKTSTFKFPDNRDLGKVAACALIPH